MTMVLKRFFASCRKSGKPCNWITTRKPCLLTLIQAFQVKWFPLKHVSTFGLKVDNLMDTSAVLWPAHLISTNKSFQNWSVSRRSVLVSKKRKIDLARPILAR